MLVFKDYIVKFEIFITFFKEKYEHIGEKMIRKKKFVFKSNNYLIHQMYMKRVKWM